MVNAQISFVFFKILSTSSSEAFAFFQGIQAQDAHLWPRTAEDIHKFATEGELFGIRRTDSNEFVGLCYATLAENEYEIGGLIVAPSVQGLGLGNVLIRFAIAHVIANERPWHYGHQIIAHIHESNNAPRKIFDRSGFKFLYKEPVPDAIAPSSMLRNAEGKLVGDKFEFPRSAVPELSRWVEEFDGRLHGGAFITIDLPPAGIDGLRKALREELDELQSQ